MGCSDVPERLRNFFQSKVSFDACSFSVSFIVAIVPAPFND